MSIESRLGMAGQVRAQVQRAPGPPLSWRLRNILRPAFIGGWLANRTARAFSKLTGIPTLTGQLQATLIKADGLRINYGVLCYRVVTNAGVAFLVDDWDNDAQDITTMNIHASGLDNTAENVADTALGQEGGVAANRLAGTKSQPAANQLQTVATQSYTGTNAIVEHGLFSALPTGTSTLWDRSVFAVINVTDGDSIQWTYTCTITAGS